VSGSETMVSVLRQGYRVGGFRKPKVVYPAL
jgi:hypothetical protein